MACWRCALWCPPHEELCKEDGELAFSGSEAWLLAADCFIRKMSERSCKEEGLQSGEPLSACLETSFRVVPPWRS